MSCVIDLGFSTVPLCDTVDFSDYIIQIGPVGTNDFYRQMSSTLELKDPIPNPSDQVTNIVYFSSNSVDISFQIINLLGETVYFDNIISKRGVNDIIINTSSFSEGIYIYSISNNTIKSSKETCCKSLDNNSLLVKFELTI